MPRIRSQTVTRDRAMLAIRQAAQDGRGAISFKLVDRAARLLECSPSNLRALLRNDPSVQAVKVEAEEVWRAAVEENLRRARMGLSGRTRDKLAAADAEVFNRNFGIDFSLFQEALKSKKGHLK